MNKYYITYFLMMQGMPEPQYKYYGVVMANSEEEAIDKVALLKYPNNKETRIFFRSCLSAKKVKE